MVRFDHGPAANKTLALHRAPVLLRVVMGPRGKLDALDQVDDEAQETESIHVYRRVWNGGNVHVLMRPRAGSGWFAMARYVHLELPEQEAEALRDRERWQHWARATVASPFFVKLQETEGEGGRCPACGDLREFYDPQPGDKIGDRICEPCLMLDFAENG